MTSRVLLILPLIFILSACLGTQAPAPTTTYGRASGPGSAGVHNVVGGETLYIIAQRYRLPLRDIAIVNHLKAPFRLRDGQRLLLPPPQQYRVGYGDTLYDVSRLFGVNSSEIARLNNLKSPYSVRAGQVLRLPSVMRKEERRGVKKIEGVRAPVPVVFKENLPKGAILPPQKPVREGAHVASHTSSDQGIKILPKTPKRASSKFLRPMRGDILSDYGAKKTGLHNDGINIAAPLGTPVKSAENGVVMYSGNALKGSGNLVLIRHEDQWMTAYAHMEKVNVTKGQVVTRGQPIGNVGATGSVSKPQLHFEIRRGTLAMNPKNYME